MSAIHCACALVSQRCQRHLDVSLPTGHAAPGPPAAHPFRGGFVGQPGVWHSPKARNEAPVAPEGYIHNTENAYQPHQRPANQGHSLFADMNQRLINMGFPRWNLGNQVIEPIMSVVLVLMLVLFGVRGLVLIGGLYLFSQFAQR